MSRDINVVIERMIASLWREGAPDAVMRALENSLRRIKHAAGFTAPECMENRWQQLTSAFNEKIFETEEIWLPADPNAWREDKTPAWAREASLILAGEKE